MGNSKSFLQREIYPNYWKVGSVVLFLINALFFALALVLLYATFFPAVESGLAGALAPLAILHGSVTFGIPLVIITCLFFINYAKKQKMNSFEKFFFKVWWIGYILLALLDIFFVLSFFLYNGFS